MNKHPSSVLYSWLLCCFGLWTSTLWASVQAHFVMDLQADLQAPSAIRLDAEGNAYVLDGLERRILHFDARGLLQKQIHLPSPSTGPVHLATDLALGKDRLYVADPGYGRILILDRQGRLIDNLHLAPEEKPAQPVALHLGTRHLWWADRAEHRICKTPLDFSGRSQCLGQRGRKNGEFDHPYMLRADSSNHLYVVDVLNARIQVLTPKGQPLASIGQFGLTPGQLFRPNGLTFLDETRLAVSDYYLGKVTIFEQGTAYGPIQKTDGQAWHFQGPVGLARWRNRLYVVEMAANRVRVLEWQTIPEPSSRQPLSPTPDSRQKCLQCHPSWSTDWQATEPLAQGLPVGQAHMCMSCHHGAVIDSRLALWQGHQHPQAQKAPLDTRQDDVPQGYPRTPQNRLYCGSCHTPHAKSQHSSYTPHRNAWLRQPNAQGKLCIDCHARHAQSSATQLNHPIGVIMRPKNENDTQKHAQDPQLQHGLPTQLANQKAKLGPREQLICQSCHRVHGAAQKPLLATAQDALCGACHKRQYVETLATARRKGRHPIGVKLKTPITIDGQRIEQVHCTSCHSSHRARPDTPLLTDSPERICPRCHQRQFSKDAQDAAQKAIHPSHMRLDEPIELNGQIIWYLECTTCHRIHDGQANTPALSAPVNDGTLCKSCHEKAMNIAGSAHDFRNRPEHGSLSAKAQKAGLCGACHSMHQAPQNTRALLDLHEHPPSEANPRDAGCLACHQADDSGGAPTIDAYSHPWRDLILASGPDMPLVDEHGQNRKFGRMACITCHEPHQATQTNSTRDNPAFLRHAQVEGQFCVDCHGRQAHVKYLYFHDTRGREKKLDYLR